MKIKSATQVPRAPRQVRAVCRRVVVVLVLALAAFVVGGAAAAATASPAAAPSIPTGTDCLRPPTPTNPNSGVQAMIDSGPSKPRDGDPFDKNSGVSLYEEYGYAGYDVYLFDPGCLDIARIWDPDNMKANLYTTLAGTLIALTVKLTRIATDESFGKIFDPLQEKAQSILGTGLFWPLLGLAVAVTGLVIMSRSRKGDVAGETGAAVSTLTLLTVAAATLLYAGLFVSTVDKMLVDSFKAGGAIATQSTTNENTDVGDVIGANLVNSILYPSWASMTFGNNSAAAKEFGPELFKAGVLSRKEQADLDAHPDTAAKVFDAKKAAYKAVAKKIEDKYPQAYQAVAGNQTAAQSTASAVTLIATLSATGFLLYSIVRMIWAMVVVRLGFGMTPAVALIAQVPRWNHVAMELLTWVIQAVAQAVAFAFVFNVFLAGAIGGIMSPDSGWNPIVKAVALLLVSVAMWSVMRRLGLTGGPWQRIKTPRFKRGKPSTSGRDAAPGKPSPSPSPSSSPSSSPGWSPGTPRDVGEVRVSSTAARPGAIAPSVGASRTRAALPSAPGAPVGARGLTPALTGGAVTGQEVVTGAAGRVAIGATPGVGQAAVLAGTLVKAVNRVPRPIPGGRVDPSRGLPRRGGPDAPYVATITSLEYHPSRPAPGRTQANVGDVHANTTYPAAVATAAPRGFQTTTATPSTPPAGAPGGAVARARSAITAAPSATTALERRNQ